MATTEASSADRLKLTDEQPGQASPRVTEKERRFGHEIASARIRRPITSTGLAHSGEFRSAASASRMSLTSR